jgi:hypothetical protein
MRPFAQDAYDAAPSLVARAPGRIWSLLTDARELDGNPRSSLKRTRRHGRRLGEWIEGTRVFSRSSSYAPAP